MHSLQSRITFLNIIAIAVSIIVATLISAFSISTLGHESADQSLSLLCETGKNNLNYYFKSVEQSVNTISSLVDAHLDTIKDDEFNTKLHTHLEQSKLFFAESAKNANGVFTYYYRIDPTITNATGEKGFWYVRDTNNVFVEHEVTDITDDQFECRWFYEPKKSGEPLWLPPYLTDNLDQYVLSYNVPVYRNKIFIGVIGIEISYHTLGEQVNSIKAMKTGYAYIVENDNGTIIFHPYLDILDLKSKGQELPQTPPSFLEAFKRGENHIKYSFEGVDKHCHVLNLSEKLKMSIVVCVPTSEVNDIWIRVVIINVISAIAIVIAFSLITFLFTRKITKPLKELTNVAEQINKGNYKTQLNYKGQDEIGVLTKTVNRLVKHLDGYITDLNSLAYADTLTSVENRAAFEAALREVQSKLSDKGSHFEFGIAIFDCDNLKMINDKYGHDKGNVYLKNSSNLIERVFNKSHTYRLGGDEFAVIFKDEDYINREKLKKEFLLKSREICSFAKEEWEEVHVSVGIAIYDPEVDKDAEDVMIHADHLMYEHKRERKKNNK